MRSILRFPSWLRLARFGTAPVLRGFVSHEQQEAPRKMLSPALHVQRTMSRTLTRMRCWLICLIWLTQAESGVPPPPPPAAPYTEVALRNRDVTLESGCTNTCVNGSTGTADGCSCDPPTACQGLYLRIGHCTNAVWARIWEEDPSPIVGIEVTWKADEAGASDPDENTIILVNGVQVGQALANRPLNTRMTQRIIFPESIAPNDSGKIRFQATSSTSTYHAYI